MSTDKDRALAHYTALAAEAEFDALVRAVGAQHKATGHKPDFAAVLADIRAEDEVDRCRIAAERQADAQERAAEDADRRERGWGTF